MDSNDNQKLANGRPELSELIRNMPGYIYWKNARSEYMGCNNNLAKISGLRDPKEIVGKMDADFHWGKGQAEAFIQDDQEVMQTGKVKITEHQLPVLSDGSISIFVRTEKIPIYNKDGQPVGVMGVAVDITERKNMEENLRQAKDAAEAADRAKTEFLENMRHDIRTPLSGIVGFADILREEANSPEIKEYAENLVASGHALMDLLNEILEAIRVTSGEIPLVKRKFDLKKKINDVINLNKSKAAQKHIDLTLNYDASLPLYLIGDSKRVQRRLCRKF